MIGDFITLLGAAVGIVTGALVALWEAIMLWTRSSLLTWFRANIPILADVVEDAFIFLDRNLMSPLRAIALNAWRQIRGVLLKVLQKIVVTARACLSRIESYIARTVGDEQRFVRVISETEVDWSELPLEVREQMLRNQEETATYTVDVLEVRERELSPLTQ